MKKVTDQKKTSTINVTDADFVCDVLASPAPVLLFLWAPWCPYCRMLHPIVDSIALKYGDRLKVARLNVDDNPAVCSQYGIQGVPTMIVFMDGKAAGWMVGVLSKEDIERRLKTLLD